MNKSSALKKQQAWFEHIIEWENTNQSQTAFCKEKNINHVQFGYWRKKYLAAKNKQKTSSDKFIDVTAKQAALTSSVIIINHVNGIQLHLPATLPLSQLLPLFELMGLRHVCV